MNMLAVKLRRDLWATRAQVITIALVMASGLAAFGASLSTYQSLRSMQADYYDRARFAHVFAVARRVPAGVEQALDQPQGVIRTPPAMVNEVAAER